MDILKTMLCSSILEFATPAECQFIEDRMSALKATLSNTETEVSHRKRSVHSIEGMSLNDVKDIYEPHGRVEYEFLCPEASRILADCFDRARPCLTQLFGPVDLDSWIYLEYSVGQYITPHVDYPANDNQPERPKICGINLQLNDTFEGGDFFVETFIDQDYWVDAGDGILTPRPGADWSTEWFKTMPRSRWTVRPQKGTALLYGSALAHGTTPVTSGCSKKVVSFVLAGAT